MSVKELYANDASDLILRSRTHADGPDGVLPLTPETLRNSPSGNIFGMTIDAGMGWDPKTLANGDVMMISTYGGLKKMMVRPLPSASIPVISNWTAS